MAELGQWFCLCYLFPHLYGPYIWKERGLVYKVKRPFKSRLLENFEISRISNNRIIEYNIEYIYNTQNFFPFSRTPNFNDQKFSRFPLNMDAETFREFGKAAVDFIADYYENIRDW